MTSHTPLDTDNWQYVDNYFKNPGDYSYDKHYAFDHHYRFSLKKACSDYVAVSYTHLTLPTKLEV